MFLPGNWLEQLFSGCCTLHSSSSQHVPYLIEFIEIAQSIPFVSRGVAGKIENGRAHEYLHNMGRAYGHAASTITNKFHLYNALYFHFSSRIRVGRAFENISGARSEASKEYMFGAMDEGIERKRYSYLQISLPLTMHAFFWCTSPVEGFSFYLYIHNRTMKCFFLKTYLAWVSISY